MRFWRNKIVVWVIVTIMILGLVAAYVPLLFTSKSEPEPIPVFVEPSRVSPLFPLVLLPTSTPSVTSTE